MKSKLLPILMAGACLNMARADFNPVTLTSNSYTFDIVVEKTAPQPLPYCITASVGGGTDESDHTFFERGVWDRPSSGSDYFPGVPPHGTVFTDQSDANRTYQMAADYTVNNGLLVDSTVTSGTLTLGTPTTAANLAFLCTGGNSGCTVSYTVNHQDGVTVDTGSFNPGDWFGGANPAWYCGGRIGTPNGGYDSIATNGSPTTGAVGSNPRIYSKVIAVSSGSPVTSIAFTYVSGGGHDCFFAVSYNTSGSTYTPVAISGFNEILLDPFTFPLTATMDQGTNTANTGNGNNTWFEQGYDTNAPTAGLPPSGSTFNSVSQPTHHYQMGNYSQNNAALIDTNHQLANITPAAPANCYAFAFLTAGGNVGSTPMQNIAILQHADGVQETNLFYGYDWFNTSTPGALAYKANGRVQMYDRTVNNVNNGFPYLFESYFLLADNTSPVTNIVVQYKSASSVSATTYVMAISASTTPVPPVITSGPTPAEQAWYTNQAATFATTVVGSAPLTNSWLVERGGVYVPLTDGVDANGSTITGSATATLTISGIALADATNYEFIAANAAGSVTSSPASLYLKGRAGVVPIGHWNNIANETFGLANSTNILANDGVTTATLSLSDGGSTHGYSSGLTGDGANYSLLDGFMDANAGNSGDAFTTIAGLTDAAYDVYLYTLADNSRPGSATDGLPNYAVNGTTYYAPILGASGNSTYDLTGVAVGGNGFNGFVPATTYTANDFNQDIPVASFGNYLKLPAVSASGGQITVESEIDTTSFRSPLNGIELVSTTSGKAFGIHFLGNTSDDIAPLSITLPMVDSQVPAGNTTLDIFTNKVVTTTYSVTIDPLSTTPLSYQWFYSGTLIPNATNSSYATIDTNGAVYTCVITNVAGSVTSAPVTVAMVNRPALSAYGSAILALNPVAYWPLTETNGNVAFDYASTNDGTYMGSYTLGNPGLPDTAGVGANVSAGFDGSTAYVDIPVHNLNITGPITVIAWCQTPSGGEPGFATVVGHSDSSYRLSVVNSASNPRFADSGPDVVGNDSVGDANWHQLVGVYNGTNQYLYVDGQLQGSPAASTPSGSTDNVQIGQAPDYAGARNFKGNIAQVAILNQALSGSEVASVFNAIGTPPTVTVAPANPSIYAGASQTLTAQLTGSGPFHLQWYQITTANASNNIAGATNATYTIANAQLALNGYQYGVIASSAYGIATAAVTLTVQSGPAFQVADISPLTGEAYVGAPVTYSAGAGGTAPIYYQWLVDGLPVAGATNASFTAPAQCGTHTVQVTYTNAESAGLAVVSSQASLQGDASPTNITFNTDGTGWTANGNTAYIANGLLTLTDGNGNEDSSAFYDIPQYVGSFSASFIYTGNGSADGAAFIIQNYSSGASSLGGGGGGLGYFNISNSIAFEINLYSGNGEVPGVTAGTNGNTFTAGGGSQYTSVSPISLGGGDPIQVHLNFAGGVLSVSLLDTETSATFATNYVFGSLVPILNGSSLGYVGFGGGDGGATSTQTITNFVFQSVIAPLALSASSVANDSVRLSWSNADPNYQLQTSATLENPTWVAGPTATVTNGVASVTVNTAGTASHFYRLVHTACQ